MSLAKLCSPEFSPTTKERGEAYFQQGRVSDFVVDSDGASAVVESEAKSYDVQLDFGLRRQGGLYVSCNCPHYEQGAFCKHIWAVVLHMDGQFKVNMLRGRSIELVHVDDAIDVDPAEILAGKSSYELLRHTNGSERPVAANWKRALADVSADDYFKAYSEEFASSRSRRTRALDTRLIVYVLNVGATHSSGRLTIDLFYRTPVKRGGYSKAKRLSLSRDEIDILPDADDRWLLSLFFGNDVVDGRYQGYGFNNGLYSYGAYNRCHILPSMYELLVPRLAGTGRFVWLLDTSMPVEDGKPVIWDPGDPWKCELRMTADDAKRCWNVTAQFVRGEEKRAIQEAVLVIQSRLILFQDSLAACDIQSEAAWIKQLMRHGPLVVPYDDREQWLDELTTLPQVPTLVAPENMHMQQVTAPPRPRLELKSPSKRAYGINNELLGDLQFVYGEHRVSSADAKSGFYDATANVLHVRDRAQEASFLKRLFELGCRESPYYTSPEDQYVVVPDRVLPSLVRTLTAENWLIETKGIRMRSAGEFKLDVTSGVDWFELTGKLDFDGIAVGLPALLAAVRKNEVFVRLDDGSQGLLPEEWLKKYGELARLAEVKGDALRFSTSQGLLLDALLAEQQNVQVDDGFERFRNRLKDFGGVKPHDPPKTFHGTLRHYQREGLGWLHFLRDFRFGGCLADDMGLGKTVQVLALLEARRTRELADGETRRPSLVVVPKSLVFNWIDEGKRFAPGIRILNFTGVERGDSHVAADNYDLLITTYGTLRRDIVKLKAIRFDYAILDESQAIKNSDSQAAKACRLIQADHRLAMTGTPVENHLGELWSLFEFLNPAMLGRASAFSAFAKSSREYDSDRLRLLSRAIRPFLLRRTKEQVLTELPEKTEQTLFCELSPKERKAYNELRDYYRAQLTSKFKEKGFAQAKIHVLEALLRLRQAACHPGLLDPKKSSDLSAKLEALLEQIQEVIEGGHKALVFSQFTSLLAIVREHLDRQGVVYEYLDGQTHDRAAPVKRFQEDPACPLFLISLKAGGHGLNLTAADYVFILDPWWNPAVEAQAVDRAHRIGQTRRVFAYRLIARNTVEDKIVELQRSKRELADAIVSADNSIIRNLSREDLELLLS